MHRFKKGDIVSLKSIHTENARFFKTGIKNLLVLNLVNDIDAVGYHLRESDAGTSWYVEEDEVADSKITNWRNELQ